MKEKEIKTKGKYSPPKRANGNLAQPRSLAKRSILGAGRQARQTAEKEEPSRENSSQYAENRIERSAENIAQEAVYRGKRLARKAVRRAWQKERSAGADRIPQQANNPATGNAVRQNYRVRTIRGWQATRARRTTEAVRETERIRQAARQTTQTAKTAQRTVKAAGKTIKTGSKGIKAASKGIKTSAKAVKTTAKATVKTAQATARASARLAQATKAAVKAAVTAAKALAKAAAAAKAIAAAIKGLIAVIAAGGWVVLIIILVAAVIALILGSAFGLFFTDDLNEGRLKQAIVGTNTKFTAGLQARIDQLSSGGYDAVVVSYDGDYDGDGAIVNNWQDVLAVFATKNMYDGEELLDFDDAKATAMALVFNHMNVVDIDTRVETDSTTTIVDGEEVDVTTSTLYINVTINSMTYIEGAELYRFDEEKRRMLEELMSEDYNELWTELLDVDIYGGLSYEELTQISADLPTGTKGGDIAQAALSKAGTAYSVMDCSQLTQYAYAQAGVSLPRTSVAQAKYCYDNGYAISGIQLQPGDLIFWSKACSCRRWNEIHHTGIYIGSGKIVDASSTKGRVVVRNLWGENGDKWKIAFYARPHI